MDLTERNKKYGRGNRVKRLMELRDVQRKEVDDSDERQLALIYTEDLGWKEWERETGLSSRKGEADLPQELMEKVLKMGWEAAGKVNGQCILEKIASKEFTEFHDVRRHRQLIEEKFPHLRGRSYEQRQRHSKKVGKEIR